MNPRSFYQACFQYACEWSGTRDAVYIDGQRCLAATSVAIRDKPGPDEEQGEIRFYELTLFGAGGEWRQLMFNVRGEVITETIGAQGTAPIVSQPREVF